MFKHTSNAGTLRQVPDGAWRITCQTAKQISIVCCCNCWALTLRTVCLNTEWAIGIWHSWLKHFNCWWKAMKNLICYSCIFSVQLHVHLKKWTVKFKMLYLRNYISYFNKICSICCVNTHIQRLKVWLNSILSWLKYSIFSRGLFFIGAPWCNIAHYWVGTFLEDGEENGWLQLIHHG